MKRSLLELQTTPALIIGLKGADLRKAIDEAERLLSDLNRLLENLKAEASNR